MFSNHAHELINDFIKNLNEDNIEYFSIIFKEKSSGSTYSRCDSGNGILKSLDRKTQLLGDLEIAKLNLINNIRGF